MKTKSTRKILIAVLVVSLLAVGGGYAGYRGYLAQRQVRLIKQAQMHLAKPDPKKAMLCLQRVLRSDPRNVEACRLMAAIHEASRSPETLLWRNRVVELNPRSVDDRLALAQSAILFGDPASATNTLEAVDAAAKKTAAYHNIAGEIYSMVNQASQAEFHFLEAARLEPTNQFPQLNLAILRLHSTNTAAVAEARATLARIAASTPTLRCQALRELLLASMLARQTNTALELSRDLVRQTNAMFSDQLLRLDVLRGSQNAEFKPALNTMLREAGTNLVKIYELSQWQISRSGPAATLAWLRSLPTSVRTNQTVEVVIADCLTMLEDWPGLQLALSKRDWAGLEFLRHAFLTRALRSQGLDGAATTEWVVALEQVAQQRPEIKKGSLEMLLRLAVAWKWQGESEKLLWTIVNQYPSEKWAMQALSQILYADGRTRPLMQLFMQESKRSPSELDVKNNLAMTALLLDAKELRPHELAKELFQSAATNAAYASTYGFSLYLQGKIPEALKVYETLDPKELEQPSNAGYYGLVLKASGNKLKARTYLNWAFNGPLLPEERKLFEQAKAGV